MGMIATMDAAFLIQEAREHPMHVAGLQLFHKPPGANRDYVGKLYRELLTFDEVAPMFARRQRDPVSSVGNLWWMTDKHIDIEYHVRRSALPRPGRVRELLELVSRLHGSLLDRHRPLWEYHLIEGLADGRFATYSKTHHALADGVALARKVIESLSPDPGTRDMPPMLVPRGEVSSEGTRSITNPLDVFRGAARTLGGTARTLGSIAGIGPMLAKYGAGALLEQTMVLPYAAPRTMLNQPISGSRRVAAQSLDIARILKAGKARGVTLNDMVLAMSSGALRRYLIANDALPDEPLLGALGTNPYWARNWLLFGQQVKPTSGAVLVFERGSGGHVGFAIGQDDTYFYVLGGNQSDAVTVARIAKSRLLGARWPATYTPRLQRLPTMKPGEFLATTNEI